MNERLRAWHCVVRALFAPQGTAAALADTPADTWLDAVSYANAERVTGAFWTGLNVHGLATRLPADVREYLESFHALNRDRNAGIRDHAVSVIDSLSHAGIAAIPIKGAAYLIAGLEGAEDRFVSDIDLLVPADAAAAARAALMADGYSEAEVGPDDGAAHHHLTPLLHPEAPAAIELHTGVVPQRFEHALPADRIWRRAAAPRRGRGDLLVPDPTDAAAVSFVHGELIDLGSELLLIPLRQFHDLHMLQHAYGSTISWPDIATLAAEVDATRQLRRYVFFYEQLSGRRLLPGVRYRGSDSLAFRLARASIAHPAITRWRLRADRFSERRLRRRYGLTGGARELNAARLKQAWVMLLRALGRRDAMECDAIDCAEAGNVDNTSATAEHEAIKHNSNL